MALPLILLGIGAAAVGTVAHYDADETNLAAERKANSAKKMYEKAKNSLEKENENMKEALYELGELKLDVIKTSVTKFILSYQKIKNIEIIETRGIRELKNFNISSADILETKEMINVYEDALGSGVAAIGTGAVIALAANGMLPVVGSIMGTAGGLLAMGEIGAAVGVAGSAFSLGAAMTPLGAIAAPVVLFTGISASIKADENLEKADAIFSQAEAAVEKMKISEDICMAIKDRSIIFSELLEELDFNLSFCVSELEEIVKSKKGLFSGKVDAAKLSDEELEKIAISRAIFGAIKQIIDTPIIGKDGKATSESKAIAQNIERNMNQLTKQETLRFTSNDNGWEWGSLFDGWCRCSNKGKRKLG